MIGSPPLKLMKLKPWWLRLTLLVSVGSPMFSHQLLHTTLHVHEVFRDCGVLMTYACFVWLFVGLCVGLKQLVNWLAFSVWPAMIVAFTGAIFRLHLFVVIISHLVPSLKTDPLQEKADLIFKLVLIMVSSPLALLTLYSFPASALMRWISRRGALRANTQAIFLAFLLRMFQHVAEVIEKSMDAWREENPSVFTPRYKNDWAGGISAKSSIFLWMKAACSAWVKTIAVQTFAAIPGMVADFRRVEGKTNAEKAEVI